VIVTGAPPRADDPNMHASTRHGIPLGHRSPTPAPGGSDPNSERLVFEADHDALTGLYNRRRFDTELASHLQESRSRAPEPSALLLIDVDGFRFVNDSRGHRAGDHLLREISALLHTEARDTDLLARIGGDEFALLLRRTSQEDARRAAERLTATIRPDSVTGAGVSIGIATFDGIDESLDADELLIAADIALFEAKESGRGQAVVFAGQPSQSLNWVERIREAIDSGRLLLYAQPIVDLKLGTIVRDELLIRMLDAEGNVITPAEFLPTAERFGLIEEIDRLVLAKAVDLAGRSRPMSINLSGHSLSSGALLDDARAAIDSGLDPNWLSFEITETAAVTNFEHAREFACSLTDLGFTLGLDDFGTGFSSFTYLKHLPIDYVKIDVEFVRDVRWSPFDQRLLQAIVEISHTLAIKTIAEGIEDADSLAIVQGLGVDQAQGFHLGRPYVIPGAQPSLGAAAPS
jgi:diguanylate cyclase (GGDEF)-like protein